MDLLSDDTLGLLSKLLPGLLAAAVFHGLTPYPKRDALDRITAALIFTLIAELGVYMLRPMAFWIGEHVFSFGSWNERVHLGVASAVAVVFGVVWSHFVNNGYTHRVLRKWGTTKKSSLPTQWFSAFSSFERFVILHFADGRRLMGWPREWPDEPVTGHFLLEHVGWLSKDGTKMPLDQIEAFLVGARDVEAVEFLRFNDDPILEEKKMVIENSRKALDSLRKEKKQWDRKTSERNRQNPTR